VETATRVAEDLQALLLTHGRTQPLSFEVSRGLPWCGGRDIGEYCPSMPGWRAMRVEHDGPEIERLSRSSEVTATQGG
jgi:hypothetical protein